MYEVDFLPIEKTGELGSKSGDAICLRFTQAASDAIRIVVIDGGFGHTGDQMVDHIRQWYGNPGRIDLVVSTHPDQDHLNGLAPVLEAFDVAELLIHNPHEHAEHAQEVSNIEVIDALITLAEERGTLVTEPFTGLTRFNGQFRVLGPTVSHYEEMLQAHLDEVRSGGGATLMATGARGRLVAKASEMLDRVVAALPLETLSEDGITSPRNDSSVVSLVTTESNERMLFTGDAGIKALDLAWDEYERVLGGYENSPLDFFQVPHHGSKRNLSPSLLDRIFGRPGVSPFTPTAFISSAKQDPKHPSPKVTNALKRRGANVYATEGKILVHKSDDVPMRPGYGPAAAIQPLDEHDD